MHHDPHHNFEPDEALQDFEQQLEDALSDNSEAEPTEDAFSPTGDEISEAQRKRLFVIAKNEGGYTTDGLKRLIGQWGYTSTKNIGRDDYDGIIEEARLPEYASRYNRDPSTRDMFDGGDGSPSASSADAYTDVDWEENAPAFGADQDEDELQY